MEFDSTPWVPLSKDLSQSKVALITTAGLHVRGDKPFISDFKGGDPSFRVIPSNTSPADILQSHVSIGFDHTGFYKDMNIAFPIDRLRELVDRGVIGSVSDNYYSFMGAIRDPRRVVDDTGPQVAQLLKDEGVDVAFLVPI
jgi:D-proline reductase (dithiol) PrdB